MRLPNLAAGLVIAVGGAAAGSFLTYYLNSAKPAQVEYRLRSTTLGDDEELQAVLPEVQLVIGDRNVSSITVQTVELEPIGSDFVEDMTVAMDFDRPIEILGPIRAKAPSVAHSIACEERGANLQHYQGPSPRPPVLGFVCVMRPINETGRYEVSFATTQSTTPRLSSTTPNVHLVDASTADSSSSIWQSIRGGVIILIVYGAVGLLVWTLLSTLPKLKGIAGQVSVSDVSVHKNEYGPGLVMEFRIRNRFYRKVECELQRVEMALEPGWACHIVPEEKKVAVGPTDSVRMRAVTISLPSKPPNGVMKTPSSFELMYSEPGRRPYPLKLSGTLGIGHDERGYLVESTWQDNV